MNRVQRTAAGLLAAVLLCEGCYTYRPLVVHVRDRESGRPLAGALVQIDAPDPRNPARVLELLNPFSPAGGSGVTDAGGSAAVRCVAGRPVEIWVMAVGCAPQGLFFDEAPGSTEWLCPEPGASGPVGCIEVRLGP